MKKMELVKSVELDCTLGDLIKLQDLSPGMLIHLDGYSVLVGDCTPFIRPTDNDGGIGWDFNEDYCLLRVNRVDYYSVASEDSTCRDVYTKPVDYRELGR